MTVPQFALCVVIGIAVQAQAPSQPTPPQTAGAPATDVFLAPLRLADGKLSLGPPENISNSPGYDNQPFFAPDGASLFFTSDRVPRKPATIADKPAGQAAPSAQPPSQMDIFRYDLKSRKISQVTSTDESEFSPTVTPDGRFISVIRVEADGRQRLWKFQTDGRNPQVVLERLQPVGYHAWLDQKMLALFVLGQPATLQIADSAIGTAEVVARNIGQSIQKMPDGGVSFVQQAGDGAARTLTITQVRVEAGKAVLKPLTPAVSGATQAHVAWTPDGTLLMAHAGALYAWKADAPDWRRVADLETLGLRNVTRLAVSPSADRLALVAMAGR